LTSNVISNLRTAPLQLQAEEHQLRYDLGCSLSLLGRAAEAFAQAVAIDTGRGGKPLELKVELLNIIARALKFNESRPPATVNRSPHENHMRSFTLQLELQVRREIVLLTNTNANALLDLAALLCRLGTPEQLAEGIEVYIRALQVWNISQPLAPRHSFLLRLLCTNRTSSCRLQSSAVLTLQSLRATQIWQTVARAGC
jgi:hypothetical protein